MILNIEWIFILLIVFVAIKSLTRYPKIDDVLGMAGASVVFYLLIKAIPFYILKPTDSLDNSQLHLLSGFISFCLVGGMFLWLRFSTYPIPKGWISGPFEDERHSHTRKLKINHK